MLSLDGVNLIKIINNVLLTLSCVIIISGIVLYRAGRNTRDGTLQASISLWKQIKVKTLDQLYNTKYTYNDTTQHFRFKEPLYLHVLTF